MFAIFGHVVFSNVFCVLPPSVLRFGGAKKGLRKGGPDLEKVGFPRGKPQFSLKFVPKSLKIGSWSFPELLWRPRGAPGRQRGAQEAPKSAQETPKSGQEAPKSAQDMLKTFQNPRRRPSRAEFLYVCSLECPEVRFRRPLGRFLFICGVARQLAEMRFVLVFPIQNASWATFASQACVHEQISKNRAPGPPKSDPEVSKSRPGEQNRARAAKLERKRANKRRRSAPEAKNAPKERPKAKNGAGMLSRSKRFF